MWRRGRADRARSLRRPNGCHPSAGRGVVLDVALLRADSAAARTADGVGHAWSAEGGHCRTVGGVSAGDPSIPAPGLGVLARRLQGRKGMGTVSVWPPLRVSSPILPVARAHRGRARRNPSVRQSRHSTGVRSERVTWIQRDRHHDARWRHLYGVRRTEEQPGQVDSPQDSGGRLSGVSTHGHYGCGRRSSARQPRASTRRR